MKHQSWLRTAATGLLTGLVAALSMTVVISALRYLLGLASPPELIGDRIAPLFSPEEFFELLSSYGGYNQLKIAGVRGVLGGQLAVGALGGLLHAVVVERERRRAARRTQGPAGGAATSPTSFPARLGFSTRGTLFAIAFAAALWLVSVILLWPTLGTHYGGLPPTGARLATLAGLLVSYGSYAVALVLLHRAMITRAGTGAGAEAVGASAGAVSGRRAALTLGLGAVVSGLLSNWLVRRKLFDLATFGYDGLQYLGPDVEPVTPNERFYTVTKNVIDPRVNKSLWQLEVTGLVAEPRVYRFEDITALRPAVTQETTLACISYSVGGGLMSNARWKGVPMRRLIEAAQPRPGVVEVLLHAADGYTDTFPIEKAMDETTLVVYEMNGEPLPDRHGYPVRVIVPGLYGEKNVKWITRIELVDYDAKGFYEQQGWGPNFHTVTHSRIDGPDLTRPLKAGAPVMLKGIAYGGDAQGVSKVEVSFDGGGTWREAKIEYPGTKLAWALWSYPWTPERPGEYELAVRATDGAGRPQIEEYRGVIPEGSTGLHRLKARVEA
jgi:DMSO/TMAO reductase YedYZ molybdopterin-dependent catalytic subunit